MCYLIRLSSRDDSFVIVRDNAPCTRCVILSGLHRMCKQDYRRCSGRKLDAQKGGLDLMLHGQEFFFLVVLCASKPCDLNAN